MKKILVTGGLGFIGSNLIKILIKKKYFVINIDKVSYASNFYNLKDFTNNKNYKFYKANINDRLKIKYILAYHLNLLTPSSCLVNKSVKSDITGLDLSFIFALIPMPL